MSKKTTTVAAAPVAAKNGTNRSELIRQYKADNPNATPTEIAKALTTDNVTVSSSLVSSVLGGRSKGGGLKVETIKAAATFVKQYKGKIEDAETAIEAVGAFIDQCGSAENALAALTTFREVSSVLG